MASLPPSIANASREQLQQFLVDSLKKLKVRDRKIEELQQRQGDGSSAQEVAALQQKLLSSERAFEARLEAEKELLVSEWQARIQALDQANEDLSTQLVARELYAARLESELAEAREQLVGPGKEAEAELVVLEKPTPQPRA